MNSFVSMEVWLVAILGTLLVLAGFALFARWCSYSPAVAQRQLEKLRVGMTASEVVAIIGQPREFWKTDQGKNVWLYGARMKRHVLMLQFSEDERMTAFAHGIPRADQRNNPFPEL